MKTDQKGNIVLIFAALIVIALLAVGVIFYFYQQSQSASTFQTPKTVSQNPSSANQASLTQELNQTNLEEIDGDFTQLDKDLQNL